MVLWAIPPKYTDGDRSRNVKRGRFGSHFLMRTRFCDRMCLGKHAIVFNQLAMDRVAMTLLLSLGSTIDQVSQKPVPDYQREKSSTS